FGDGSPNSTVDDPNYSYPTPGTYTLEVTVTNECGSDTFSQEIEVVGQPEANFNFTLDPDPACEPVIASFEDQSNQWSNTVWEILPNDSLAWCFTDPDMSIATDNIEIEFKLPGTYTITQTASNICGSVSLTETIEIFETPDINLVQPDIFCDPLTVCVADLNVQLLGSITSVEWSCTGCTSESGSGDSYCATFDDNGTMTVTTMGPCGTLSETIDITIAGNEPISFGNSPTTVCQNADPFFLDISPGGGSCSSTNAACALIDNCQIDPSCLTPGQSYTFTYSAGTTECPNTADFTIEILPPSAVELDPEPAACDALVYTPSVDYVGTFGSYAWTFEGATPSTSTDPNPSNIAFNTPGDSLLVTITAFGGECGDALSDTIYITIQEDIVLMIDPIQQPLCSESAPIQLTVNGTGGNWSGPGVDANGIFDPGSVTPDNTYTITYAEDNEACSPETNITIEVVSSEAVSVDSYVFCTDSSPQTLEATPAGGTWSGAGITDPILGTFDPAMVPAGTTTPVTYQFTDANLCPVTATTNILVEALPVQSFLSPLELCLTDTDIQLPLASNYSVDSLGGSTTWSGPGVLDENGLFNPVVGGLTTGSYTIFMAYERGDCSILDSLEIILSVPPELVISPSDTLVCITDSTLALTTNLTNGVWSGPGVDPSTGIINLNDAGEGVFTYTFVFAPDQPSCSQSDNLTVEIIDLSNDINAGTNQSLCQGPATYTLSPAVPSDGLWDGPGIINTANGTIDLSQLELDVPNTYTYCIESTQVEACSACDQVSFTLLSNPAAGFEIDGLPCLDESIVFSDTSTNGQAVFWDFGNTDTSTDLNPNYSYGTPGNYTITMIAENSNGCQDTITQNIEITTPPVNNFTLDSLEGCAPFTVSVNNNSFGNPIEQQWFLDGTPIDDPNTTPLILDSVITDSIFVLSLEVSNFCATITESVDLLVHPYPLANFGINVDEGCSPLPIEIADVTLGNPETLFWDFGNGNTFSGPNPPAQEYTTTDSTITVYTITLTASNECGTTTIQKDITVFPPNVEAFIELDTLAGCQPFLVSPASFSTPGADVSWCFISPSGVVDCYNEIAPTVSLEEAGEYTIILTAANCGADTDTAYIEVLPAPEVSFTHPAEICLGDTVFFENTSSDTTSYFWEFGNGDTSTLVNPFYVYDSAGVYTVSLTGFSFLNDCPTVTISTITVNGLPEAAFTVDTLDGCPPFAIQFTNESIGANNYTWDFGDNSPLSFAENPVHIFQESGDFTVSLVVFDSNNCFSDTTTLNIFSHPLPEANFTYDANVLYCARYDSIFFENISTGAIDQFWVFQNDTFFTQDLVLPVEDPGDFQISLTVQNVFGCTATTTQTFSVAESPLVAFDPSSAMGCEDLLVSFTNNAQFSDFFTWNFDGQNTSTQFEPSYLFTEPGTYTVQLIGTNTNGCPADTSEVDIIVWPKPQAIFSFEKDFLCGTPVVVQFLNQSIGNVGNEWSFGDGNVSIQVEPDNEYLFPDLYDVVLEVVSDMGCRDTAQQTIDIFGQPQAFISLSDTIGCELLTVSLGNNSVDGQTYLWTVEGIGTFPVQ
ncbi:MAG: PKD domain-containing protein, partial [Bacteroidota bacterium]